MLGTASICHHVLNGKIKPKKYLIVFKIGVYTRGHLTCHLCLVMPLWANICI